MVLVEKCDEGIDGNKMIYSVTLYDFGLNKKVRQSCMIYVILLIVAYILTIMGISGTNLYFYRYTKGKSCPI